MEQRSLSAFLQHLIFFCVIQINIFFIFIYLFKIESKKNKIKHPQIFNYDILHTSHLFQILTAPSM